MAGEAHDCKGGPRETSLSRWGGDKGGGHFGDTGPTVNLLADADICLLTSDLSLLSSDL